MNKPGIELAIARATNLGAMGLAIKAKIARDEEKALAEQNRIGKRIILVAKTLKGKNRIARAKTEVFVIANEHPDWGWFVISSVTGEREAFWVKPDHDPNFDVFDEFS